MSSDRVEDSDDQCSTATSAQESPDLQPCANLDKQLVEAPLRDEEDPTRISPKERFQETVATWPDTDSDDDGMTPMNTLMTQSGATSIADQSQQQLQQPHLADLLQPQVGSAEKSQPDQQLQVQSPQLPQQQLSQLHQLQLSQQQQPQQQQKKVPLTLAPFIGLGNAEDQPQQQHHHQRLYNTLNTGTSTRSTGLAAGDRIPQHPYPATTNPCASAAPGSHPRNPPPRCAPGNFHQPQQMPPPSHTPDSPKRRATPLCLQWQLQQHLNPQTLSNLAPQAQQHQNHQPQASQSQSQPQTCQLQQLLELPLQCSQRQRQQQQDQQQQQQQQHLHHTVAALPSTAQSSPLSATSINPPPPPPPPASSSCTSTSASASASASPFNTQNLPQQVNSAKYEDSAFRSSRPCVDDSCIDDCRERSVTTLMIRNLPREVTQSEFLQELDANGFADLYDFAYMPTSFEQQESKGYAFVNFISVAVAGTFIGAWHKSRHCGARGPFLNISPATVQGLEANIQKWGGQRMERIRNPALRPFVKPGAAAPERGGSSSGGSPTSQRATAAAKWQGPPKRSPSSTFTFRRTPAGAPMTSSRQTPLAVGLLGSD